MIVLKALLLCVLFCFSGSTSAKALYFSELLDGDGQSITSIRTLFADEQGFLWLSGDAGTYRFDGFERIKVNREPTRALYRDDHGQFWSAGTMTLNKLQPGTFESKAYPHLTNQRDKPEHEFIYDMLQTVDGRHLFATKEGLSEYHRQEDTFEHFTLYYDKVAVAATTLFESNSGQVYVGTDVGLFTLDTNQLSQQVNLPKPLVAGMTVNKMAELADGTLVIGSNNGLYLLGESLKHYVHDSIDEFSLSYNNITALLVDNEQTVWVGTSKGLNIFDPQRGRFQRFFHHRDNLHGIKNNLITDIYLDNQSHVFIATYDGINRFHRSDVFLQPSKPASFENQSINNVWSMVEQDNGALWVGTFGSGFFRHNGKQTVNYTHDIANPHSLIKNRVSALRFDAHGHLWVGTTKGIQLLNRQNGRFYTVNQINTSIYDIQPTTQGDIWLAADTGVYRMSDNGLKVQHFNKNSPMKVAYKQWVRSVYAKGNLLLAGSDKGLNVLDFSAKTTVLHEDVGSVLKIMEDSQSNIWVLAMQGLSYFDYQEGIVRSVAGIRSPTDDNGCNGMVEDRHQQLWLVCNNSLKVLDIASKTILHTYSVDQGVDLKGFLTGAQSIINTGDGRVLIAQRQGISEFKPVKLKQEALPKPLAITKAIFSNADGELPSKNNPFHLAHPVSQALPHSLQKVVFEFSSLDHAKPKAAQYQYRLVGYEQRQNLTEAGNRRAVYTNLPHGDYRFEVTAIYPDSRRSTATYDFTIAVAPWRSWWAYTIYLVVLVMLGIFIIALRTRTLTKHSAELEQQVTLRTGQLQQSKQEVEQLMNEREKLIENIYHQTRTPLQIMLGNIDDLLDGTLNKAQYAKKQTDNVHSLVSLTDRILNVTKVFNAQTKPMKQVDFTHLVNSLCLGFTDVAKAKQLSFDSTIDNYLQLRGCEQALTDIITNVVSNSIKYTDKGGVQISAWQHNNQVIFRCVDSGIGIPELSQSTIFERYHRAHNVADRQGHGIGLALVKEWVDSHEGNISVESEVGRGTIVTMSFPSTEKLPEQTLTQHSLMKSVNDNETVYQQDDRPTLLVIEDNLELADFINKLLAGHYNVLNAVNGQDGLAQARGQVPDLVLSDVMMPQMDGFVLTEQLRGDEITCHIPILLVTAKNDNLSREKGYALGANDFINKPFKAEELLHRVANQLALVEAIKVKSNINEQQSANVVEHHDRLIGRFLAYIESHFQDCDLQIKTVCDALHVSNRQLERKVKHFLNMTPNSLLNEYRLSRAAEWICQGKKPNEVYLLCGFNSHAYFSKRFKQKFEQLPSQYKSDSQ